jgi:hypothetical protein
MLKVAFDVRDWLSGTHTFPPHSVVTLCTMTALRRAARRD